MHYLRCRPDRAQAAQLAENVRNSALYDQQLMMYKVNAPLDAQPMEIGRARTFSPGWFENESVWLHMEYKYLLELLRSGLYTEFYRDFRHVFVPFMQPAIYGRSTLENSSFIVSSANPDPSRHGTGYMARLSGATAEFIHILHLMAVGEKPFGLDQEGQLQLQLRPALPDWLFTAQPQSCTLLLEGQWREQEFPAHSFSFMFLGEILVTYHNPGRKDTFGPEGVAPHSWKLTGAAGQIYTFTAPALSGGIAQQVRDRQIRSIAIELR